MCIVAGGMDSYAELLHRNPALKPMLEPVPQESSLLGHRALDL